MFELTSNSPEETQSIGAIFSASLGPGDIVCLDGDLGAGKTCFTQGVAQGLQITDPGTSPTFTLANRYDISINGQSSYLHHLDVYRLEQVSEADDLDIDELSDSGIVLIEWANKILSVLPKKLIYIKIAVDSDGLDKRTISFSAEDDQLVARLEKFTGSLQDYKGITDD